MTYIKRITISLRCMATNHSQTGLVGSWVIERLPIQHEVGLVIQWQIGIGICVHEEVCPSFIMGTKAVREEMPMGIRDAIKPLAAVRRQNSITAACQPFVALLFRKLRRKHHQFMVATQRNKAALSISAH